MIIQPGIAKANLGLSREDVTMEDHPLNPNPESRWNNYFKDNEVLLQIDKDVRRLYPDMAFFQRPTEFPCQLILDSQNEYETLRRRVEQTTLKAQTVNRNRSGVTNVSSPGKALNLYPSNEYEVLPNGCEAHWEVVERILFIYAKLNPGIAYVQGMNEIVGPIYYTFATDPNTPWKEHAEADTFFCFTNLMSENRDNFIKSLDDSQCGITYKMESVFSMLKEKDLELYRKLYFTFRWLTLLLSQEFLLPDVIRIWDSLFSDQDRFHFLILVCCAMLTLIRDQLLAGDFTTNMRLLQLRFALRYLCFFSHPDDVMFDASAWRVRSIWDGVKLEVVEHEGPVVLHSFTHLDPELSLLENATQELGEEVEDGAVFSISVRRVQVQPSVSKGQRWLGVDSDTALSLYAKLQHLPGSEGHRLTHDDRTELRNTISSILGAWLDQYSEDFWKPPEYSCLRRLISYLHVNFPGSDLERRACNLLAQFHRRLQQEPEPEVLDHGSCPFSLLEENGYDDDRPNFLTFDPTVVAEQFTLMDAELFKKVVPYHCLGSIWSQRDKKGKEHLAPTIRATVAQFNCVTNCVISTCLSDRTPKHTHRAKVLERWIEVARECRILKNFSSLRAILSALQCNAIHRLKRTWDEVSRENVRIFHELSEIFSDENNHSLSRELLIKEGTSKFATVTSAGSSSSDVEEINISFISDSPDMHEKKFWESTSLSSLDAASGSGSSSASSSSVSSTPHTTTSHSSSRSHKRSVSGVSSYSSLSLPLYNQQVDDCCIIRVSLDVENGNMYKSILLKIPDNANVFYAMNSSANYDFVLKKRGFPRVSRTKHVASSTLPRMKQKGLRIAKGIF
ncbi:TBC1 domain family member 13 [Bagarius yarrelli]|uniref:TBC1 domain family member 13 n=1 Tax=Bagarius yarrelli TaxID=175774 RepID=A0A556V828_BAGYA|nr:TBC1 domain family member 13 [Bagarius yarrelli]